MKGICFNAGGGIGDILRVLLTPDVGRAWCQPYWGQIAQWKKDNPDRKIRLVLASHNPAAKQLFELYDWIDDFIDIPWENDGTVLPPRYAGDDCEPMRDYQMKELCKDYPWQMPAILMTPEEETQFKQIAKKEYVLLYPFGGYGARLASEKYILLIEKLKARGFQVVIVGNTYQRNVPEDNRIMKEEFGYEEFGVINLVNKAGIRLTTNLAMNAKAYIGSLGLYMHPAFAKNVTSICLTCYEIWNDNNVLGGNLLRCQAMWYINKYLEEVNPYVSLVCLNNENDLGTLWDKVIRQITTINHSTFEYWGEERRPEVHV